MKKYLAILLIFGVLITGCERRGVSSLATVTDDSWEGKRGQLEAVYIPEKYSFVDYYTHGDFNRSVTEYYYTMNEDTDYKQDGYWNYNNQTIWYCKDGKMTKIYDYGITEIGEFWTQEKEDAYWARYHINTSPEPSDNS